MIILLPIPSYRLFYEMHLSLVLQRLEFACPDFKDLLIFDLRLK